MILGISMFFGFAFLAPSTAPLYHQIANFGTFCHQQYKVSKEMTQFMTIVSRLPPFYRTLPFIPICSVNDINDMFQLGFNLSTTM